MSARKIVWLICNNVQPPEIDTHLRHQKFAQYLYNDGYDVYIIGASYLHYSKINLIEGKEPYIIKEYNEQKLKYIFVKVSSYHENTGFKRLYSNFQFAWNLYRLKKHFPHPDIIVHNTRIPCDVPIYWTAKSTGAKYITETWDLWPYSFVTSGLIRENGIFAKLAYRVEYFIYSHAKKNIFTLAGCKQYIMDHKWDKEHGGRIDIDNVVYINNGIDLDEFNYNKNQYQIESDLLRNPSTRKIIYLGSVSKANDINLIIETAKLFKSKKDIVFLIFGDGTERVVLEKKVEDEKIANVHFMNKWVEIKYVPFIISCATINLLNYARTEEGKYGGSQGKLFQYLAAGKPIVSNNIMGYDIVNHYKAGISSNIDSPEDYKELICSLLNDDETYVKMSQSCTMAAKDFDYKNLYLKFKEVIENV